MTSLPSRGKRSHTWGGHRGVKGHIRGQSPPQSLPPPTPSRFPPTPLTPPHTHPTHLLQVVPLIHLGWQRQLVQRGDGVANPQLPPGGERNGEAVRMWRGRQSTPHRMESPDHKVTLANTHTLILHSSKRSGLLVQPPHSSYTTPHLPLCTRTPHTHLQVEHEVVAAVPFVHRLAQAHLAAPPPAQPAPPIHQGLQ